MVNELLRRAAASRLERENGRFDIPHPRGGLYFEDFTVGQVFAHRLTRTVTQMDNMLSRT